MLLLKIKLDKATKTSYGSFLFNDKKMNTVPEENKYRVIKKAIGLIDSNGNNDVTAWIQMMKNLDILDRPVCEVELKKELVSWVRKIACTLHKHYYITFESSDRCAIMDFDENPSSNIRNQIRDSLVYLMKR